LRVLTHDLGSVAAALDLRAGALTASDADREALRGLTRDIRDVTRMMRWLRGPQPAAMLDPSRRVPLADWWRAVSRLSTGVLPRGVVVTLEPENFELSSAQASTTVYAWLAAARDLVARGLTEPATITFRMRHTDASGLTIAAVVRTAEPLGPPPTPGWERFVARLPGAECTWWREEDGCLHWHLRLPGAVQRTR
jgi:hypothetical protein